MDEEKKIFEQEIFLKVILEIYRKKTRFFWIFFWNFVCNSSVKKPKKKEKKNSVFAKNRIFFFEKFSKFLKTAELFLKIETIEKNW